MGNSSNTNTAEQLVPFAGFYTLDTGGGSFFLVDTSFIYQINDAGVAGITHAATITICMDGKSSSVYDFASCCTFDSGNLTVAGDGKQVADVNLYKDYTNGNISALRGTINGTNVTGVTPFNPVQLQVFATTYSELSGGTFEGRLKIGADLSVWYRAGSDDYVQVRSYYYNHAMFTMAFELNGQGYEFEMGTTPGAGRVAGNAAKAGLLLSILSSKSYPPKP